MKLNLPKSWFLRMLKIEDKCLDVSAISPELLAKMENKKLDDSLQRFVNQFERNVRNTPMRYPKQNNK